MLDYLFEVERKLPKLLESLDGWHTRLVTYEKPTVERLFRQDGENRIYLHRIHPCEEGEAFFHLHPWPSAMRIVEGFYQMKVGFGRRVAATVELSPGCVYEMTDPKGKHSVMPLYKPTLSVMVTGPVWSQNKGMQVQNPDLSQEAAQNLLEAFQKWYT